LIDLERLGKTWEDLGRLEWFRLGRRIICEDKQQNKSKIQKILPKIWEYVSIQDCRILKKYIYK